MGAIWGPHRPLSHALPVHPACIPASRTPISAGSGMTHHTFPRAWVQALWGLRGALGFQLGRRKREGHIGHLPRRQRKVRRGGGFILGEEEVSRGQRSWAAGEGSEWGALISGHLPS